MLGTHPMGMTVLRSFICRKHVKKLLLPLLMGAVMFASSACSQSDELSDKSFGPTNGRGVILNTAGYNGIESINLFIDVTWSDCGTVWGPDGSVLWNKYTSAPIYWNYLGRAGVSGYSTRYALFFRLTTDRGQCTVNYRIASNDHSKYSYHITTVY